MDNGEDEYQKWRQSQLPAAYEQEVAPSIEVKPEPAPEPALGGPSGSPAAPSADSAELERAVLARQALARRAARKAEREEQARQDAERTASFEQWRSAQAQPAEEAQPEEASSEEEEGDEERRVSYNLLRSCSNLEARLVAEERALQAEEGRAGALLAELAPPTVDHSSAQKQLDEAQARAAEQRERRRAERAEQERRDAEREAAWEAARVEREQAEQDSDHEPDDLFSPVSARTPSRRAGGESEASELEQQLHHEVKRLEAEERERQRLINELSPPAARPEEEEHSEPASPAAPTKALRVASPEGNGQFVVQSITPEKEGLLYVNYNDSHSSYWAESELSNVWLSRWVCLEKNFLYVFVDRSDVSPEDIVLCDDLFATVECDQGEFHIQNKHTLTRRVSFRAREHVSFGEPSPDSELRSEAWLSSIADSQSVILDAERFFHALLPTWVLDDDVGICFGCQSEFCWHRLRHHCRLCGKVFCHSCASRRKQLPRHWMPSDPEKLVRTCFACASVLDHCLMFGAPLRERQSH